MSDPVDPLWLISSTGTHHIPAIIDRQEGRGKAVCQRWIGPTTRADPDPDEVCQACLDGRGASFGGISPDHDAEPVEADEDGQPLDNGG